MEWTPDDRVLLVIAHPDDECMFFSPLLMCLAQQEIRTHVLCLTTGTQSLPYCLTGRHSSITRPVGVYTLMRQRTSRRASFDHAGNASGLGSTRRKELLLACSEYKVANCSSDVSCYQ